MLDGSGVGLVICYLMICSLIVPGLLVLGSGLIWDSSRSPAKSFSTVVCVTRVICYSLRFLQNRPSNFQMMSLYLAKDKRLVSI